MCQAKILLSIYLKVCQDIKSKKTPKQNVKAAAFKKQMCWKSYETAGMSWKATL